MNIKKYLILVISICMVSSCENLDLNPLSEGSSENWYSDATEIELSLNDLYRTYLWDLEQNLEAERFTDNWAQRQSIKDYVAGTINSEWSFSEDLWLATYKGITRANTIINSLENATENVPEEQLERFDAEARFFRAIFYGRLVFLYGDVPFYTNYISVEESFSLARTDKNIIMEQVYEDFDIAINGLPASYSSSELKRATKGAALAFKARVALNVGDHAIARDAAQDVMNLDEYELHPEYDDYFYSKTRNSKETIFALPRSFELGSSWSAKNFYTRTPGGSNVAQPSWDLFASYTATDGLPIDESPLFDPKEPFKNRDPRLAMTIVEFGTEHLGVIYDPNPYTTEVLNVNTGVMVRNKDARSVDTYAAYNGLALKKGVDEDWTDDNRTDFDIRIMRYADVLLMYAEAKIELNEIDQTVLDAINTVRARAYEVDKDDIASYPAVNTLNQTELRLILQNERRVEFAWENRRFFDLLRWRLASEALTRPNYGILDPNDLKEKVIDEDLWFFPERPVIDAYGLPDFSSMHAKGLIKQLTVRAFEDKQYLFPIPSKEIIINENLEQNPGY